MKHLLVVLIAIAACGKANDIPAMRAETEGMLKNYQGRFDDLSRRADAILQRGNAIGVTSPDAANASRLFAMAKAKLETLRADVTAAAAETAKAKDTIELQKMIDKTETNLEKGYIEVNGDFDAVESWITLAEQRPAQASSRQPVVPPPPANAPPPAPETPTTPNQ